MDELRFGHATSKPLAARYSYESKGRCFAQLPECLWTQEAKDRQFAELIAAIDGFFLGFPVVPFYYRRHVQPQLPISDACTDVPQPVKRPRYSVSNFDIASLA